MMICPNCGTEISDNARFCRKCGTKIEQQDKTTGEDGVEFDWNQKVEIDEPEENYDWGPPLGDEGDDGNMMPVSVSPKDNSVESYDEDESFEYEGDGVIPPWDHTHEFSPEDISDNKVMAMAPYIMGPIGVIIALLAAQNSPYAGFHVRQGMKILILQAIVSLITILLCWTFIVPIAGIILLVILTVLQILSLVWVCKGKAIEPPILRNLKFLK